MKNLAEALQNFINENKRLHKDESYDTEITGAYKDGANRILDDLEDLLKDHTKEG